jgi:dUTP pyrophosphatase
MDTIKVSKLHDKAFTPDRKHEDDAGIDVYACGNYIIPPTGNGTVRTGITVEIPEGYMILVKPKSRSNYVIGAGVIDSNYQGEVLVKIVNYTTSPISINDGDAVAQLLLIPIITPKVSMVDINEVHQTKSNRGATGGIVTQLSEIKSIE